MSKARSFWVMVRDGDTGEQADPFEFIISEFTGDVHMLREFVVAATLGEIERRTGVKPEDIYAVGGNGGKAH